MSPPEREQAGVLANTAVMAVGTVFSRFSGFIRGALLAAALGNRLHSDIFTIANTVPNMLYILLAGGVVNAVLVPQLVRAMRNDPDGGDAYTNRIITLAGLFLALVTTALVVAAPWLIQLFLSRGLNRAEYDAQRESIIDFARYCLPQVFFYGMYVLIGQVLNARGRFGPMMWAPIANNVISIAVLIVYLVVFGPVQDLFGPFTAHQELLLGLGSTAGIAAQFVILVPYLRSTGFSYRPRFDFWRTGLGHTLRLGLWTVLFVVVNQVAYTVVVRLASGGTTGGASDGTGYSVYSQAFLIIMVPHSVITVSLATAILPRLSRSAEAAGDLDGLSRSLASTLRTALAVVVPIALLLPFVSTDTAHLIWGYGASADQFAAFAPTLALFGGGLVFFTVHYLMLRGFYSLERTRTVFWIQCAVAATNIIAALVIVPQVDAAGTAPALVLAYSCSYLVGAAISYAVLRRGLGGLRSPTLVRFLIRLIVAAAVATAAAALVLELIGSPEDGDARWLAIGRLTAVGAVDLVVLVVLARVLRIREVTDVVATFTRRLPIPRRG